MRLKPLLLAALAALTVPHAARAATADAGITLSVHIYRYLSDLGLEADLVGLELAGFPYNDRNFSLRRSVESSNTAPGLGGLRSDSGFGVMTFRNPTGKPVEVRMFADAGSSVHIPQPVSRDEITPPATAFASASFTPITIADRLLGSGSSLSTDDEQWYLWGDESDGDFGSRDYWFTLAPGGRAVFELEYTVEAFTAPRAIVPLPGAGALALAGLLPLAGLAARTRRRRAG